jgi:copper resistance protein C
MQEVRLVKTSVHESSTRRGPLPAPYLVMAIALLFSLLSHSVAHGHAILIDSAPKADTSERAPTQLLLRFNTRVEANLSSVALIGGPENRRRALPVGRATTTSTLVYPLPGLEPGSYRVEWKAMSADGHVTDGVLRFTVVQ